MNMLDFGYFLGKVFFETVFLFYRRKISGKEKVPQNKGFILACNHISYLDAPLLGCNLFPRPIHWIIAKWVYTRWFFRPLCIVSRCVPVNGSTKYAQAILDGGGIVGIFPEGCVVCSKQIQKGRHGVAVLALKTGAPVVPCYIEAELYSLKRQNIVPKFFRPIKVTYGAPLYFERYPADLIPEDVLNEAVAKIINAINALGQASA